MFEELASKVKNDTEKFKMENQKLSDLHDEVMRLKEQIYQKHRENAEDEIAFNPTLTVMENNIDSQRVIVNTIRNSLITAKTALQSYIDKFFNGKE